MYTAKQSSAMKKMSPKRRASFKKMLSKSPTFKKNAAKRRKPRPSRGKQYLEVPATRSKAAAKRSSAKVKRSAKARAKKMTAAQLRKKRSEASKKAWRKRRREGTAPAKRKTTAKRKASASASKRRKPRTYGKGKYRALKARYGPKTRYTYMYKTKKGRARHIPSHAILGYPSAAALRAAWDDGEGRDAARIAERVERLMKRRDKASQTAARRVRRGLGVFTPNKGDEILSFEEWKEMRRNPRKKKTTRKKKRSAASYKAAAKKGAATRKRNAAKKSRKSTTRKRKTTTRKRKTTTRKRKGAPRKGTKAARSAAARKGWRKRRAAGGAKKRKTTTRRKRRTRSVTVGRRGHKVRISYAANRRRRRSYKRNAASVFMQELQGALKLGALVTVGYVAHRSLAKVINDMVYEKIDAFKTNETLVKYRTLIASVVAALIGVPLAVKGAKALKVKPVPVAAGVAASFIHGALVQAMVAADQPKVLPYLSAYPNAEGSAIQSQMGSYYEFSPHQVYNGAGAYYEIPQMSGFGQQDMRLNQLTQAAAGYGASPMLTQAAAGYGASPMLTQAAAGMGASAMLTQAAAGTGEYVAYGASGIGEYEEIATSTMPMMVDEGVHPNTHSAEQALSVAEAAAGVGSVDVPLQSTVNPTVMADPIGDLPGGSRAGVFQGGDGIFG